MEDGGADGFSVADRCRTLRAAVSLGLPPIVAAWVPSRRLDGGHGAWGRDGDDVSDCRPLRTAGHCGLRRGAESSDLGHGNMARQETAAKRGQHPGMRRFFVWSMLHQMA